MPEDAPSGAKGFLSKRIFNIPVIYLLIVPIAALAFFAWRVRTVPDEEPPKEEDATTYGSDDLPPGVFTANPVPAYVAPTDVAYVSTIDTNEAWIKRGAEWAVASGLAGFGDAQQALQLYVDGAQLTYQQGVIRDAVAKQFGAPPELVVSGGTQTAPARRAGQPPTTHTVQNRNDDTFSELSRLYYGSTSDEHVNLIQASNLSLVGGPFPAGTKVQIPAYRSPKYYITSRTVNTYGEVAARNGTSIARLKALNDNRPSPFKSGTRIRVA